MTHIYIKLDDPLWLEVFQDEFKEILVEKNGCIFRFPMHRVIKLLKQETDEMWNEYFESKENDESKV